MNRIEDLKKEYEAYQAPASLQRKIKSALARARKERRNKAIIRITGRSILGVAAAMLTIVILVNSSPQIARAMGSVPILGALSELLTFRGYTERGDGHEANIATPQITPSQDGQTLTPGEEQLNKSIEEYTRRIIDNYEAAVLEAGGQTPHIGVDTSCTILSDNDRLFSLRMDTVENLGSSASYSKIYHFDKTTDQEVILADAFVSGEDYITAISENIREQMRQRMAEDQEMYYFLEEENEEVNFRQIKPDQDFYLDADHNLVVVFDKYEVAPGYLGEIEFTVPHSVYEDMLAADSFLR
jgi:hypothetical protein